MIDGELDMEFIRNYCPILLHKKASELGVSQKGDVYQRLLMCCER